MSFSSSFEKKFNDDMHGDGQPGRAPAEVEDADMALKMKGRASPQFNVDTQDFRDKKDLPPRFSTLFDVKPSAPAPPPPRTPREYVREHYPEPKRRAGIYMPLYLFILFVAIFFFESTIIFAYTIIGLYNNAPSRLFPWAGPGTAAISSTDCAGWTQAQAQPAINIAPNFVIPQGHQEAITELVTIAVTPSISSSTLASTSTTSSSSSTIATSEAAAVASGIAGLLGGLGKGLNMTPSSGIALVTVQPERSTVTSVTMITKDASGNVISPAPTTTLTTFIPPPSETGAVTETATGTGTETGAVTGTSEGAGETQEPIVVRPTTVSSG